MNFYTFPDIAIRVRASSRYQIDFVMFDVG